MNDLHHIEVGNARMLVRAEAANWCRDAVMTHESFHQAALARAERTLQGRGPVAVMKNPTGAGPSWAVRRLYRGGLMMPLGDRFLRTGSARSFRELENSARVEELGFATPRVVGAAAYRRGAFYQADLITEFVTGARTLADELFGGGDPTREHPSEEARREALACAGDLIGRMSKSGILHRDLNVGNILIARDGAHIHATLIDLDRCEVTGPLRPVDAGKLRRRLIRSIRKVERTRVRPHDSGDWKLTNDELNGLLGGEVAR